MPGNIDYALSGSAFIIGCIGTALARRERKQVCNCMVFACCWMYLVGNFSPRNSS